ncbi:family 43 glycosylhydrolase [Alicyclobacillus fastidiosus]|uniref:Family 43 glycosylhydrolase n=1 Tax=Alicyclobacillus fastidiosus TaxID=392011 RepID=A0ABY6ZF74_9BACL|nr:family 43 glycosylhydrolase [Alicyclobacillus fastidiosus]WAH41380.1 family 43 glycosylhydrolase [Alicyclobacillus fastidiosus]GMA62994.1 endo-1,4-beta-xylanase [Alicyclobacillus fastidiosus]
MVINTRDTYCNPIVLPDYPKLRAISRADRQDVWGRSGKVMLSEADIMREAGLEISDVQLLYADVRSHEYGRIAENDVRATADPTVCYFDGRWYLYTTSGGIYDSDDMVHWTAHFDDTWMPISAPMAPTVERFRGGYYATANSTPLHIADNPLGPWRLVGEWTLQDGREVLCNDPMIFADDDDRLYLYWGLGISIMGAELDPERPNMFLTEPKVLFQFDPENWWERFGAGNEDWFRGFIEGSWMVKLNGTYYLTYSAAGTEYFNYCMGAYVSDSPLGEFKLQPSNPVSRSRTGFIKGGGHGSIVRGPKDTLWCFYTIPVSADAIMERRIGMDPVGVAADGSLYALTGCDVPQFKPGILERPEDGNQAGLVQLCTFKPTLASSYAPGHYPLLAVDEALHTWWQPAEGDNKPQFGVLLQGKYFISAIRLMWKDIGLHFDAGIDVGPYQYSIEYSDRAEGDYWTTLVDATENEIDLTVDYRTFDPVLAVRVRITITGSPEGVTPGLLDFSIFGVSAYHRKNKGEERV